MAKNRKEESVLELIKGFTPIDSKDLDNFKQAMAENVIPKIVKIVVKRRLYAEKSRQQQLKID